MTEPLLWRPETLAAIARLAGASLAPARLAQVLDAYGPILEEIAKLRELDLREAHPAVVFEPTVACRRRP